MSFIVSSQSLLNVSMGYVHYMEQLPQLGISTLFGAITTTGDMCISWNNYHNWGCVHYLEQLPHLGICTLYGAITTTGDDIYIIWSNYHNWGCVHYLEQLPQLGICTLFGAITTTGDMYHKLKDRMERGQ